MSFIQAFAALLIGGIIMGFSPVLVREADVGPFASAFWRVAFALPLLYLWASFETATSTWRVKFSNPAILAGFCFAGDLVFWHLAILNTTMANATFMVCLAPVWVACFSGIGLGEKPDRNAIIGLFVCLLGLALLLISSFQIDTSRLLGDVYGLITSLFLGSYFMVMRVGRRTLPSGQLFLSSTLVTTVCLFLVAIIMGGRLIPSSGEGWATLAALGLFTHAGGQGLVTLALGALTAMFSSLVIFIEAVTAAFFGWLIFNEHMEPLQWLGCGFVLAGVWISRPK